MKLSNIINKKTIIVILVTIIFANITVVYANNYFLPEQIKSEKNMNCNKDKKCLKRTKELDKESERLVSEREAHCLKNPICTKSLKNTKKRQQKYTSLCMDTPVVCAKKISAYVAENVANINSLRGMSYDTWCTENKKACKKQNRVKQEDNKQREDWCKRDPESCAQALLRLDQNNQKVNNN